MFSILWAIIGDLLVSSLFTFSINAYITEALKECFPPSVPMNGTYIDVKNQYTVKDKVQYRCNKGFLLVGDSERTCLSNETWTGKVPFCDTPSQIRKTTVEHYFEKEHAAKIMDKNSTTCLELGEHSGYGLQIDLETKTDVEIVTLFLPKGRFNFEVSTQTNSRGRESCGTFHGILTERRWIKINCSQTTITDTILIRAKENVAATENLEGNDGMVWTLCEVEVYSVDESKCRYPPDDFNTPGAQLVVGREKAMLKCDSTETEGRLYFVCENNNWNKAGEPTCEELKKSKLRNVIIIAAVVASVIVGVLVIAACIYRRRKNSVLVLRENELYGFPEKGEYTASPGGSLYADLNYEEIPLPPARRRTLPEIIPSKMPDLLTEHVTEETNA